MVEHTDCHKNGKPRVVAKTTCEKPTRTGRVEAHTKNPFFGTKGTHTRVNYACKAA